MIEFFIPAEKRGFFMKNGRGTAKASGYDAGDFLSCLFCLLAVAVGVVPWPFIG